MPGQNLHETETGAQGLPPAAAEATQDPTDALHHMPWLAWIERTGIPISGIAVLGCIAFAPFYDFNSLTPRLPLSGAAFPPALVLALCFLLALARGARDDLRVLVGFERIDLDEIAGLVAGKRAALIELCVGLAIGFERAASQMVREAADPLADIGALTPGGLVVLATIVTYSVVQVHLLAFCVRQALVYRKVARGFRVDLMTPELNNLVSNPLIRFIVIGLVSLSFGLLLYELAPYASLQRRVFALSIFGLAVWLVLLGVSLLPLLALKSRIATVKSLEINLVRQALKGDRRSLTASQFGPALSDFSAADLMYYEDRVKAVWEWPFEAHVRRLVMFGLLPPLTWILAALVEIIFEAALVS